MKIRLSVRRLWHFILLRLILATAWIQRKLQSAYGEHSDPSRLHRPKNWRGHRSPRLRNPIPRRNLLDIYNDLPEDENITSEDTPSEL